LIAQQGENARYLLTLPFNELGQAEVSVFITAEHASLFKGRGVLHSESDGYLSVVVHSALERDQARLDQQMLPPCRIHIGNAIDDLVDAEDPDNDGQMVEYSDHKIGGRPYFVSYKQALMDAVSALEKSGGRHLLQLDFPGNGDFVSGNWPFSDCLFNLYVRFEDGIYNWYYFWQT